MYASTPEVMINIDVNINAASLEWTREYHQRVAGLRSLPDVNNRNQIAITPKAASILETGV
jgi:hypothetical protein